MSSLRDTLVSWVDQRIADVLAAPPMWGSPEAVEMQVLQLLEIRALALRPGQELADPRRVFETYVAYLGRRFPKSPQQPLFTLVNDDEEALVAGLRGFIDALRPSMLEENPFQHSALAIRLVFEKGHAPVTSAFTGYYEEFRRAARAVARPLGKATGRVSKDLEVGTDFTLDDARVRQENGAPAEVVLRLGTGSPEQQILFPGNQVRDALSGLLTMAEWADSDATIEELPVDDAEQRTRLAVQARRLLPSRGIETVSVGGQLVGRSKPVEFRGAHERRFLSVIEASIAPQPFDERDEVRAVDLDRGMIALGKKRVPCYVRPGMLGEVAARLRARACAGTALSAPRGACLRSRGQAGGGRAAGGRGVISRPPP
jgi:hypothetical protein